MARLVKKTYAELEEEVEDLKDYNDKLHKQNERLRKLLDPSRFALREERKENGLKPKRISGKKC